MKTKLGVVIVGAVWLGNASAEALDDLDDMIGGEVAASSLQVRPIPEGMVFHVPSKALGISPALAKARLSAVRSAPEAQLRGAKEAKLYADISPRVVMVVTDDALGSGALIGDGGTVLTNWHVVEGKSWVGVIYKPASEGASIDSTDIRRAQVVRIDEVADLALLRVEVPPKAVKTIELGSLDEIPVGSDVHAIGHPTGETWTYTKGFVSQMRLGYEWATESGKKHMADVIQTQTPINPGNSGGPLLSDGQKLVGVNSFKAQGEGLNFAVSVDEVRRFLARTVDRYAESSRPVRSEQVGEDCEMEWMGSERSVDPPGTKFFADVNCDGELDGFRFEPDDTSAPIVVVLDSNGDGRGDTMFADLDRDGLIDQSAYDVDGDGETDLYGYHRNGEIEPYRLEEAS